MEIKWNLLKNERLKKTRGVSFEELIQTELVAVKRHPTKEHQDIMLFWCENYIWVVSFVKQGDEIFLKTLFPSRQYTKMYKRGEL